MSLTTSTGTTLPFPKKLSDISLDLFALVQYWKAPGGLTGSERGRAFEESFVRYAGFRDLRLVEKSGSCTLNGQYSGSGFRHESDAVVRLPGMLLQVELKHLSSHLGKNELLIFNQKGFDFLYAPNSVVRELPLYRAVLSAHPISDAARIFALQWGMIVVEPDRIPLPALYAMAANAPADVSNREILLEIPQLVVSLQQSTRRFAKTISDNESVLLPARIERALSHLQLRTGNRFRRSLEHHPDGDLVKRFREMRSAVSRPPEYRHVAARRAAVYLDRPQNGALPDGAELKEFERSEHRTAPSCQVVTG